MSAFLVTTFLFLTISAGACLSGGLYSPVIAGYFIVIQLGWIFGDIRGGRLALAVCLLGGIVFYNLEFWGFSLERAPFTGEATLFNLFFWVLFSFFIQWSSARLVQEAQKQAQESDEKYRVFLENIPVVTYINDTSSQALTQYISPQVEKVVGMHHTDFVSKPGLWLEIIHPEDRDRVKFEVQNNLSDESFQSEYRLVREDGSIIWVRDEAKLIRDFRGKPAYRLGVWTDIAKSKRDEQVREETVSTLTTRTIQLMTASEVSAAASSMLELNLLLPKVVELIRSRFDYYYVCIFLADARNERAILSAATGEVGQRMLESRHSLPIGSTSMIGWCIANDHARIALDVGREAVRFNNPLLPLTRSEIALPLRARGRVIGAMGIQSDKPAAFTDWDVQALQTMADQVANAIHTARLFDERSQLLKEMEAKNAELERFTYTVSHDLKSPLVTIRGYLGYLRSDAETGDMARFDRDLARIIKSTETMQELLQDLLDLSRVGRTINPSDDIALGELVEETIQLIIPPEMQKKIVVQVLHPLPVIRADKTRMIEVLQNLLSNAIKFMGRQAQPTIVVGCCGVDAETDFPILYVRDNGIGIATAYHEQVFELFNRLNPEIKGTGIGLALVKRIIEVHGGRVWVESEGANKGCTFFFTVPPAHNNDS
ncbi:MAG: PAS domain-containing protein [Chloroflexi bacterium]|nr:PAS domain-containing protein [Chloroflexota bacterium]